MFDRRLERIRERVDLLAAVDPTWQVFGAVEHEYQMGPPLSADELAAAEEGLGVRLPEEYRAFVTAIGARGAGPYYGLTGVVEPEDFEASATVPAPARDFLWDDVVDFDAPVPPGCNRYDGALHLSAQGCGDRSLLVVSGPLRGRVWADFGYGQGPLRPESADFLAWYEEWLDRAMLEWVIDNAVRIAKDGLLSDAEVLAVAEAHELLAVAAAEPDPKARRALGYLRLREGRWADAEASFMAAARAGDDEPEARLCLDRARLYLARGQHRRALQETAQGLAYQRLWASTYTQLQVELERALRALGRCDEARGVLNRLTTRRPPPWEDVSRRGAGHTQPRTSGRIDPAKPNGATQGFPTNDASVLRRI